MLEAGRLQEVIYQDTGCEESETCLKCPLPACIHDVTKQQQEQAKLDAERANAVLLAEQTMTRLEAIRKVAKDYGVTVRTIRRILARS
ncbi:hypothetical protein LCGC14_0378650 [marine sediment metagenome]|uniref:Resolvase HTH domain-containing protein n=1 Tax=marine sediment metagenome TaxID=412755 RepID=A0A0F9TL36_9ZZZZ